MYLPIFFVHRGDSDYLSYSLLQAKESNPHSEVILIGDEENKKYSSENIIHVMMDDYWQSAAEFSKIYRHCNVNPYEYNLFDIQRWFVLRDFIKQRKIKRCCYIDSDVMLYADVNKPEFVNFSLEFTWTSILAFRTLNRFCTHITNHYRDPILYSQLVEFTRQIGEVIDGTPLVSDMMLSLLFLGDFDTEKYSRGVFSNSFFDGSISSPLRISSDNDTVEIVEGKKKVYAVNGILYCKSVARNSYIQVNSLHFQGHMKSYMKYFALPNIGFHKGVFYFDYSTCQWVPVEIEI